MYIIRHNTKLRVFSENNDWTDHVVGIKEYETRDDALADVIKRGLTDCNVISVKDYVRILFEAGRITIA